MAVTFTYGTIGSGKTYGMVLEAINDLQDGRFVPTINLFLKREAVLRVLRARGMSAYDASQAAGRTEMVWTSSHFRNLRNARLKVDEAHFWWPQNQYRKIDMEDILTTAMSRKRAVDIHIISQLEKSVNQNVRDLALDSWQARALHVEPFYSGLKIMARIGRATGLEFLNRPAAFFYSRVVDGMGTTQSRKDGTLGPDDKRVVFLNPMVAECYDTLQEVSSPVLDEMRDQSRQAYLISILKGETRPQAICPVCEGRRSWRYLEVPVWEVVGGLERLRMERVPFDADELRRNQFARAGEADCEHCDDGSGPRGYIYTADHPDYAAAEALADQVTKLRGGPRGGRAA